MTTVLPNVPSIPTEGALAGLKVVDLMWVVAGPTATRAMADFGATVVRIESANRIETARGIGPFHDNAQGPDHSGLFSNMNANKLGLSLNLGTQEARGVLLDLIKWCDVLTESFSPRAMRAWGMDFESLKAIRPDLIMLSTCLFGQAGPLSRVAGFGTMGAAIGGYIALARQSRRTARSVRIRLTRIISLPALPCRQSWPRSIIATAPVRASTSTRRKRNHRSTS